MSSFDPNSPLSADDAARDARFDDALRAKFAGFDDAPAPDAWATLSAHLPAAPHPEPAPRPTRLARLRTFGGGVGVGLLLAVTGLILRPDDTPRRSAARVGAGAASVGFDKSRVGRGTSVVGFDKSCVGFSKSRVGRGTSVVGFDKSRVGFSKSSVGFAESSVGRGTSVVGRGASAVGNGVPAPDTIIRERVVVRTVTVPVVPAAAIGWVRVTRRDTVLREARAAAAAVPTDSALAGRVRALVLMQGADLTALGRQLDSLKKALPEGPPSEAIRLSALPPSNPHPLKPSWLLALEATPTWAVPLPPTTGPGATERAEPTGPTLTRSAQIGLRLGEAGTPAGRWQVRAGLGETRLRTAFAADFGRTNTQTHDTTTTTTDVQVHTGVAVTVVVHLDSIPRYEPRLNGQAQIIGYDTTWVSTNDTTYQLIITHDTVRTQRLYTTQTTRTLTERRQQALRPEYKFWSLPFAVSYHLVERARWALGVQVGGTVQVFRGGTRAVWDGGAQQYQLRPIGPREGPYRPVSLQLLTGLEASYRLSNRLSATVAPSARWWAVPVGRAGQTTAGPDLVPGLLLGLSYGW